MLNPNENTDQSLLTGESIEAVPISDTESGLPVGSFFMDGWIKVYRKIRENWIWQDPVKFRWWVDMLLEVNHASSKVPIGFEIYECGVGQSVRSLQGWANRWGVSKDTVRNFFTMLQKDGMISNESLKKTTRITICNYSTYQVELHDKQTVSKRKANAKQTQSDPNKKNKNKENSMYARKKKILEYIPQTEEETRTQNWLNEKYPRVQSLELPLIAPELLSKVKEYGKDKVVAILSEMENKKDLFSKYIDAGRTLENWLSREKK